MDVARSLCFYQPGLAYIQLRGAEMDASHPTKVGMESLFRRFVRSSAWHSILVGGPTWHFGLAYALFTIWAAFGYIIDILLPINWREPIRWQILIL